MSQTLIKSKKQIELVGHVGVEDAEILLEFLVANPKLKVNLERCEHFHTAILQVLSMQKPNIVTSIKDPFLALVCQDLGLVK